MFLNKFIDKDIFRLISLIADRLNVECYVVGGFVRDLLLNKEGPKDIDILVIGDGIALSKKVVELLPNKQEVKIFKNFGTSMILFEGMEIEFVGARKESYSRDSRNPLVEKGTFEDDLNRRDFTINTMTISLNKDNYGEFIDKFKGLEDLENKIIKTPYEADITYSDDPLRMFRAVRFASQLDFEIEENSFNAIIKNRDRIDILSKERIIEEVNKILLSPNPSVGFLLLDKCNILEKILPELTNLKGVEIINDIGHKDNFYHTLEVVDKLRLRTNNVWLLWAGLLHDIGKAPTKYFDKKIGWTFHSHELIGSRMVPKLFKRLKLPLNDKMKYIQKIISMSSKPIPLAEDNISDSAIRRLVFEAGDDLEDLLKLCESDITTKNKFKLEKYLNNYKIIREKIQIVEDRDKIKNFKIPINGNEIINTFIINEKKNIGDIKQKIKDAILDGVIKNNYEESFKLMLRLGEEMGMKIK